MMHNHGPSEGEGLDCPTLRLPNGTKRGACLIPVCVVVENVNGCRWWCSTHRESAYQTFHDAQVCSVFTDHEGWCNYCQDYCGEH